MKEKDPFKIGVARRLKAAMAASSVDSAVDLAAMLGRPDSQVRNWTNGSSMPMVQDAIRIKKVLGLTLDWLYDNDPSGLPAAKVIHLMGVMEGHLGRRSKSDRSEAADQADESAEVPAELRPGQQGRARKVTKANG